MAGPSGHPETLTNQLHSDKYVVGGSRSKARGGESGRRLLGGGAPAPPPPASAAATHNGGGRPPFMILPDSQFHLTWIQVRVVVALYIVWVTPVRVVSALP